MCAVLDAAGVPLDGPVSPGPREGGSLLGAAAVLDHAGCFSSVAMAARSTLHLYDGHESWAVGLEDLEEEQRHDLAVRLSGVATVLSALPGGISAARETRTFAALVWYLAAVDVVLAFGTEMDPVEAGQVADNVARHEQAVSEIRVALGGGDDATDALGGLVTEVEDAVAALPDVVAVVAAAVRGVLPEIESSTEAFQAEAASTPAVGLLIARLQAEMEGSLGDPPAAQPEPEPAPKPADPLHAARRRAAYSARVAGRAGLAARIAALGERREQLLAQRASEDPAPVPAPDPRDDSGVHAARDQLGEAKRRHAHAVSASASVIAATPRRPAGPAPGHAERARVAAARGALAAADEAVEAARDAIDRFHDNDAARKAGESRIGELRERRLVIVAGSASPRREKRRLEKRIAALSEPVERTRAPQDNSIDLMQQEVDATAARARRAQRVLRETRSLPAPTRPEAAESDDHPARIAAAQSRVVALSGALAEAREAIERAVSERRQQHEGHVHRSVQIAQAIATATTRRETVRAAIAATRQPVAVATVPRVPTSLRLALDAARAEVDAAKALREVCIAGRPADPPDALPAPADLRPLREAVGRAETASLHARAALIGDRTTRKADQIARRASIAEQLDRARARRSAVRIAAQSAREAVPVVPAAGVTDDIILAASLTRAALDESRSALRKLVAARPTNPGAEPLAVPPSHIETAGANLRDATAAAAASVLDARASGAARRERIGTLRAIATRKREALAATPSRQRSQTAAVRDSAVRLDAAEVQTRRARQRRDAARPAVRHARRELARCRADAHRAAIAIGELDDRIDALSRDVRRAEDASLQARRTAVEPASRRRSVEELLSRIRSKGSPPPPVVAPPPPMAAPPEPDAPLPEPAHGPAPGATQPRTSRDRDTAAADDATMLLSKVDAIAPIPARGEAAIGPEAAPSDRPDIGELDAATMILPRDAEDRAALLAQLDAGPGGKDDPKADAATTMLSRDELMERRQERTGHPATETPRQEPRREPFTPPTTKE